MIARAIRFVLLVGGLFILLKIGVGFFLVGMGLNHSQQLRIERDAREDRIRQEWRSKGHEVPWGILPSKYDPSCPELQMCRR